MTFDFRPPIDRDLYREWVDSIGQYQKCEAITALICSLHFNPNEYGIKHRRTLLKFGSIPTIFASNQIENATENHEHNDSDHEYQTSNSETCQNCINTDAKVGELLVDMNDLKQKLLLQSEISEYWRTIALKYEPERTLSTPLAVQINGMPNESMYRCSTSPAITDPIVPEFDGANLPIKVDTANVSEEHIFKRKYTFFSSKHKLII